MAQTLASDHLVFEAWLRRGGPLHRLDPRLKLAATLALLLVTGLWNRAWWLAVPALALTWAARLPLAGVAARAALVLPFTAVFASLTALMGDPARAITLLWRASLSAWWVIVLMGTTPLHRVLEAAARFGAPRLVVEVIQFTWRYLGVIAGQATRMRTAALARGAEHSFTVSASTLAALFAGSYARSERIHRAMLARGAGMTLGGAPRAEDRS